jgi:uncharacterized damage-inducible protein DinB
MDAKLAKAFNELELARLRLLEAIDPLPEAKRQFKPSSEDWSMVQVVTHLMTTEKAIQNYMQTKVNKGIPLKSAGIAAWGRSLMVTLFLRYKKKIKAPAVVTAPNADCSYEQARQDWAESRMHFRKFLDSLPADLSGKEIFRHPLAGMLNAYQTVDFMREHVLHHLGQIQRLNNIASC